MDVLNSTNRFSSDPPALVSDKLMPLTNRIGPVAFFWSFLSLFGIPSLVFADGKNNQIKFNRDIRPILSNKCFACHGPDSTSRKADIRFDVEGDIKADLGGYRIIAAGQPDKSEMIARITHPRVTRRMPPPKTGKEVTAEELALLKRWIKQGAKFEKHWSYAPPRRPKVPEVKDAKWCKNPIDDFILSRLEAEGLKPSARADRVTLIRRLHFDLTGLPPTPADVGSFLKDKSPEAYRKLVDRLLKSPHYSERMAMYWLDLVRYASTVGYHGDQEHNIAPYRDWVIKAFHDNMPFDQFTTEQLAGDLLPNSTVDQKIATGYNRLLQTTHEGGAQDGEYLAIYFADRVRNVSAVWMGATVGCAQCHNHKYDPYTAKDFYSLGAFFADVKERGAFRAPNSSPTKRKPEIQVTSPLDRLEAAKLQKQIQKLEGKIKGADGVGEQTRKAWKTELETLRKDHAAIAKRKLWTMVTQSVKPRTIRVLNRGDWMDKKGKIVAPAVPEVFEQIKTKKGQRASRLDLAKWLTSKDNPQTARVFVNRLWALYFGRGISKNLEDTGSQGSWPSHPELLDWLAKEFVEKGWDVKHMVRLMVLSNAYQQSSVPPKALLKRDPENELYARQSRFRLPAEMIRDNALAVSGLLVDRLGGPSARPYQPSGYYAHLNFPKRRYNPDRNNNQYRRGVYVHWQRQFLHPMLRAFDAPSREECTAQRSRSNTPLQALTLLNDPTFVEAARVFAARIIREGGKTPGEKIRWAWRAALSRNPSGREMAVVLRLQRTAEQQFSQDAKAAERLVSVGLAPRPESISARDLAAWTTVARAILNLNETITRN